MKRSSDHLTRPTKDMAISESQSVYDHLDQIDVLAGAEILV
jgi:hypothetical protein